MHNRGRFYSLRPPRSRNSMNQWRRRFWSMDWTSWAGGMSDFRHDCRPGGARDRPSVPSQRDAARTWAGRGFGLVRAAVACPRDGFEPLLIDALAGVLAQAEGAGVDARQCQPDFLQRVRCILRFARLLLAHFALVTGVAGVRYAVATDGAHVLVLPPDDVQQPAFFVLQQDLVVSDVHGVPTAPRLAT